MHQFKQFRRIRKRSLMRPRYFSRKQRRKFRQSQPRLRSLSSSRRPCREGLKGVVRKTSHRGRAKRYLTSTLTIGTYPPRCLHAQRYGLISLAVLVPPPRNDFEISLARATLVNHRESRRCASTRMKRARVVSGPRAECRREQPDGDARRQ